MANQVFTTYKQLLMTNTAGSINLATGVVKWALIKRGSTSEAQVLTQTDITSLAAQLDVTGGAILAHSNAIANKSVTNATLFGDDVTLVDPGTVNGEVGNALVLYFEYSPGVTRNLLYVDTATNLPLTMDGVSDIIRHDASGIFRL
jgi:hypothetical protein